MNPTRAPQAPDLTNAVMIDTRATTLAELQAVADEWRREGYDVWFGTAPYSGNPCLYRSTVQTTAPTPAWGNA